MSNNVVNPYRFVSAPWDFEDNMVYANQAAFDAAWVPSNTKVDGNPTTDKLDIEDDIDYQDDVVYYDLTSTSNTDNIWRFIVDLTTFTQNTVSANEHAVYILLSDNTGISTASNDCYGFKIMAQISGGSVYRTITSNGVAPSSSHKLILQQFQVSRYLVWNVNAQVQQVPQLEYIILILVH